MLLWIRLRGIRDVFLQDFSPTAFSVLDEESSMRKVRGGNSVKVKKSRLMRLEIFVG